jgi:proline iminopeptidase
MKNLKTIICILLSIIGTACEKNDFELTAHADEFFFLRNDGADLPVWVKGNTASKTLIVYLHGGPGGGGSLGSPLLLNSKFVETITSKYAMVFFDQRNSGSSQGHYDKDKMTEAQFVDDLDKLILLLQNKYGTDISIFLYGVSWGGYLGTAYLVSGDNQDKIKGWINDSGNHDELLAANYGKHMLEYYANQQIALQVNTDDWNEILDWCHQKDTILEVHDFAQAFTYFGKAGRLMSDSTISSLSWDSKANTHSNFFSPFSVSGTFSNMNTFVADNYKTLNLTDKLSKIRIPVLTVRGKYDFSVPAPSFDQYFDKISSSVKQKITYPKSGHVVWSCETDSFSAAFITFVESNR